MGSMHHSGSFHDRSSLEKRRAQNDAMANLLSSFGDWNDHSQLRQPTQTNEFARPQSTATDSFELDRLPALRPTDSASSPYQRRMSKDTVRSSGEFQHSQMAWNRAEASRPRPQVSRQYQDVYVNIMVAGESGQGKTTCIENLFAAWHPDACFAHHDGSSTSPETFRENPDLLCARLPPVQVEESAMQLHYSIQDTPGYGNDLDVQGTLAMLIDHIRAGKAKQAKEMEGMPGGMELPGVELRHMMDVCLYFIPAHRLKGVDLYFMAALAKEVAVIPVIAKSDCMTPEELVEFKSHVLSRLVHPGIDGIDGPIEIYNFPGHVLEEAGVDRPIPPFAVVCSKDMGHRGSFWPVRRYAWGTVECANYQHSDFQLLKELVFERGFASLRKDKWRRYLRHGRGPGSDALVLELSDDLQRMYTAVLQARAFDWGKMALMLVWCLPAAFALGMYRAHLAARGRETGLQSIKLQDLLAHLQRPVQDKQMQASVLPVSALSLSCLLADDTMQDRRTLSCAVNVLHDLLGHHSPICQQAACIAMGNLMRNAPLQWRAKLAWSSIIDAVVPLLQHGHMPRQQAALYCLRIMAVVPAARLPPAPRRPQQLASGNELVEYPASQAKAPQSWHLSEPALSTMADAGALGFMVDLGIASGQIETQEAVVAALKLFTSPQLPAELRQSFLQRLAMIDELPRLLDLVSCMGSTIGRCRAEAIENALQELPALEFFP
ncbi:hypothetical protein WJX73_003040 [Symbiochloris irregularis]|uniref:Septin-type G domain-containing protein n=1 Tax=Symbiochloris irregularis TaxID=706552 RepID=A0AAW1P1D5_9CHLO